MRRCTLRWRQQATSYPHRQRSACRCCMRACCCWALHRMVSFMLVMEEFILSLPVWTSVPERPGQCTAVEYLQLDHVALPSPCRKHVQTLNKVLTKHHAPTRATESIVLTLRCASVQAHKRRLHKLSW